MDQLSPQDSQFLYIESDDNLTHVTSISVFDQTTVPDGRSCGSRTFSRTSRAACI